MFATAVALFIFCRPQLTARVLQTISLVKPQTLLVIADGPRADHTDDRELCAETRAVIDRVDWECDVIKNYSDVNLGCGNRMATGISWVFDQVPEAIILEDDCVPHPTFFPYCEELLERYRDDERVMHIAGCTYSWQPSCAPESYFFTAFNGAWGWATWRRAWRHFHLTVPLWSRLKTTSWLADLTQDESARQYWAKAFQAAYEGDVHTWDHQWTFACWANSGLSIKPAVNLVSNIGYGPDATHTFDRDNPRGNLAVSEMKFPLVHPPMVLRQYEADRRYLREVLAAYLTPRSERSAARRMISRVAPGFVKDGCRRLASTISAVGRARSA